MRASQRRYGLAGVTMVLLLSVLYHLSGMPIPSMHMSGLRLTSTVKDWRTTLSAPISRPIDADFTDPTGKTYELPQILHWRRPLAERILIVDMDTRMPNGDNELLNEKPMDWATHESKGGGLVSNAIMDHYLYAQIHGYDYKYYHAQQMKGYKNTWIKPHLLALLLEDYDFVVFLDADVTVTHMDLPLEWLFNRWNITSRTSIAMPWDVVTQPRGGEIDSQDSKGLQVLNTGFIIVQNLPMTFDLLRAWADCPTEKRYKGCAHWKKVWGHEQRAFSEYIRYDFNPQGDNIVPIACDDAMGWPGASAHNIIKTDCRGRFFRHYTLHKDRPREEFQNSVMQLMTRLLQERVMQNIDTISINEEENKITLSVEEGQLEKG